MALPGWGAQQRSWSMGTEFTSACHDLVKRIKWKLCCGLCSSVGQMPLNTLRTISVLKSCEICSVKCALYCRAILSDPTTHHKMQRDMPATKWVKLKLYFWSLKSNWRTKHGFAESTSAAISASVDEGQSRSSSHKPLCILTLWFSPLASLFTLA